MCKIYGYCRISRKTQDIQRQIRNIQKYNDKAIIVAEAYTGTTIHRPQFDKLVNTVKSGDTIIFDSISRMSRNAADGYDIYMTLYQKGVNLIFLNEQYINTEVFKANIEKNIEKINSENITANNLINSIIDALSIFMREVAKQQIYAAFEQAEKEVIDLHTRTTQGIETARLNGKRIGTQKGDKLTTKKSISAKADIKKYNIDFGGALNDTETIKIIGISRNTFYKYKRELKQQVE